LTQIGKSSPRLTPNECSCPPIKIEKSDITNAHALAEMVVRAEPIRASSIDPFRRARPVKEEIITVGTRRVTVQRHRNAFRVHVGEN
jgi:hypothetical protein